MSDNRYYFTNRNEQRLFLYPAKHFHNMPVTFRLQIFPYLQGVKKLPANR